MTLMGFWNPRNYKFSVTVWICGPLAPVFPAPALLEGKRDGLRLK